MCNTVDHCLVPREKVGRFVDLAAAWVARAVPDYSATSDCTGIISDAHRERVLGLLEEAREVGCTVVLRRTSSGGACVNACALQGALPSLGFGGVGTSGTGRHHGIDGFREFSNPRGVFVRGENDLCDLFVPPYASASRG